MFSNRLAFAALTVTCVAAAASGGYLATRHSAAPHPEAAAPTPAAPELSAALTSTTPAEPVEATEAVVGDNGPAAARAGGGARGGPGATTPSRARRSR